MPDLLAELRDIFGAPTMTEEQASAAVRTAHTEAAAAKEAIPKANRSIEAGQRDIEARDTEIARLKAALPAAVDPALAAGRIENAVESIDNLLEKGCIMPPQADALKGSLKDAMGKPNLAAVTTTGVVYTHAAVKAVLALNKPAGLTGEATGAQVQARTVPGTEGADPTPESVTPARKAELLAMAGMAPAK